MNRRGLFETSAKAVFLVGVGRSWLVNGAMAQTPGPNADTAATVRVAGDPVAGATVTLYAAGEGAPAMLAQGQTSDDGTVGLHVETDRLKGAADKVLYLVVRGGIPKAAGATSANDTIALLAVLGTLLPKQVTVNEFTTVASAFTAARFINGESISGPALGLRIAAGNTPHFVNLETGGWGSVLIDPINSTLTTTLANFNTLSSLISAFFTVADDAWRARFLKAATPPGGATPKNTFQAMAGIARAPWTDPNELFALFDQAYPQPKDGGRRKAPFLPYLRFAPPDFALSLWFGGGGLFSAGDMAFDAEGNLWSGCNWMPGAQNWIFDNIGGGTAKLSPNGTPLSPPITGFTGMGTDAGIGWGTGVTRDKVWVSSFNGKIGVFDLDGKPAVKESDFPFTGLRDLMGIGVAANGDVWIAASAQDELVYFPGGRVRDGKIVKVDGLNWPFGIAVDAQNRVWVSNSASSSVLRFPADDPSRVESIRVGNSPRGVALDSKGNLWVSNLYSSDAPPFSVPQGASIMEQFKIIGEYMKKNFPSGNVGGTVSMIRPDGSQPDPKGYTNGALDGPWGIAIDGDDNVWVGNSPGFGTVLLAGDDPKGRPPGTKTGDLIHNFTLGTIPLVTSAVIDPAGNVWVASNWLDLGVVETDSRVSRTSTWGGGNGVTVIYGVAAPVKTPLMGQVQAA